jgi:hypothetical protein
VATKGSEGDAGRNDRQRRATTDQQPQGVVAARRQQTRVLVEEMKDRSCFAPVGTCMSPQYQSYKNGRCQPHLAEVSVSGVGPCCVV